MMCPKIGVAAFMRFTVRGICFHLLGLGIVYLFSLPRKKSFAFSDKTTFQQLPRS